MKVECVKERFEKALTAIEKVAAKNATLPVLSCVLLETRGGTLLLRTTNLELGIEISIPVKVVEDGVVAVPIGNLLSFVSTTPQEKNLSLETKEGVVVVSLGKSTATFNTMNYNDFPTIPLLGNQNIITVPVVDIINGVKSVVFSSAVNTVKPEYASVMITIDDNTLLFVATDSFRLAEKKIYLKHTKEPQTVLLPSKNAQEIARILGLLQEKNVEICVEGQQISFTAGTTYITSRLVGGNFPDYKQIIPKTTSTEVVVSKQDFINTMKIANVFSDTFLQVNIRVLVKEKIFEIKTKNQTIGEQTTNIPAAFQGEDVVMSFNHRYLVDCLSSVGADTLSFVFSGPNKPVIIRGVSDKTFLYLVMPMNR